MSVCVDDSTKYLYAYFTDFSGVPKHQGCRISMARALFAEGGRPCNLVQVVGQRVRKSWPGWKKPRRLSEAHVLFHAMPGPPTLPISNRLRST